MIFILSTIIIYMLAANPLVAQNFTEKNLTNIPGDDRHPFFSPNGSKIIFESNRDGNWEIYIMDKDGSNQTRLTSNIADDRMPSFHPSGNSILFQSNRSGKFQLYTLNLKNLESKKTDLLDFEFDPEMARYSNKGDKIIFTAKTGEENNFNLFLFKIHNQKVSQITFDSTRSAYGSFLSDDDAIIFHSRRDTDNRADEVYIQNLQTKSLKRLTNWPKHNFCPSVSPDGQKIAYVTSMEGIRPELYVMDIDGKNQRRLTFNTDGDTQPEWSPDGNQIVFTGYRNGNFEICLLSLEN